MPNVYVYAYNASDDYESETETSSSGTYTVTDLPAGTYELEFSPSNTQEYLPQYYDNESSLATATAVTVTSAQATTGINAALQDAGHITGTVTNSVTAAAVDDVEVTVDNATTDAYVTATETSSNGTYNLGGLTSGDYIVSFYDCGYVGEYYNDESSQGNGRLRRGHRGTDDSWHQRRDGAGWRDLGYRHRRRNTRSALRHIRLRAELQAATRSTGHTRTPTAPIRSPTCPRGRTRWSSTNTVQMSATSRSTTTASTRSRRPIRSRSNLGRRRPGSMSG